MNGWIFGSDASGSSTPDNLRLRRAEVPAAILKVTIWILDEERDWTDNAL